MFEAISIVVPEPSKPNFMLEVFFPELFFSFLSNWKLFAFIFVLFIIALIFKSWDNKIQFFSYLHRKDKEKKWRIEFEEKKRQKELKKIIRDTVPNWTSEIIQSLDSKVFIKLVANYFEATGFLIKYPSSIDSQTSDIFFLYKPEISSPFAIVKCRAIGSDSVSLKTFTTFYDLSRQYGVINMALVTTGGFIEDVQDLIKHRKGINLIGMAQLISLLSKLPIEEQTYLFADMLLNKK